MSLLEFSIDSEHPSIPGHFPGNPIVPGAVVIDRVIKAFLDVYGANNIESLVSAKFLQPIATNQKVVISFKKVSTNLIAFECISKGEISVLGRFRVHE